MAHRTKPHTPPPVTQLLGAPLPRTGHPLGALAQAWLVLNGMVLGGGLGAAAGFAGMYYGWRLCTGRFPPHDVHDMAGGIGALLGLFLGLVGSAWVLHRAGKGTISFALLTMSFIPVVGPVISVVCGLWWLYKRWRGRGREAVPPPVPGGSRATP